MSRQNLQELIQNLQEFYKCPSCDTSYSFDDISYLGELNHYYFIQLTCHDCSLPVLTAWGEQGPARRRKTDLQAAEEAKFASMGHITADEIAGFHRYISRRRDGFSSTKPH